MGNCKKDIKKSQASNVFTRVLSQIILGCRKCRPGIRTYQILSCRPNLTFVNELLQTKPNIVPQSKDSSLKAQSGCCSQQSMSGAQKGIHKWLKGYWHKQSRKEGMDAEVGKVELKVDNRWLQQRRIDVNSAQRVSKNQQNNKCFGGVILTNQDGLIVCKNTLDARIQLAYQHMLPIIRSQLFS